MKTYATLFAAIVIMALSPCYAQSEDEAHDPLALFEAYQVGYLQLVAVSCFQLYSSAGIIATDLGDGHIDGATAMYALGQNRLLLSVCTTTLDNISALTPQADEGATAEFLRLSELLVAVGELHAALDDVCIEPTDSNAEYVEQARLDVEALLDKYAGMGE